MIGVQSEIAHPCFGSYPSAYSHKTNNSSLKLHVSWARCTCGEGNRGHKDTYSVPKSPLAKEAPCRNVSVLKRPSAGMSAVPNGAHA